MKKKPKWCRYFFYNAIVVATLKKRITRINNAPPTQSMELHGVQANEEGVFDPEKLRQRASMQGTDSLAYQIVVIVRNFFEITYQQAVKFGFEKETGNEGFQNTP